MTIPKKIWVISVSQQDGEYIAREYDLIPSKNVLVNYDPDNLRLQIQKSAGSEPVKIYQDFYHGQLLDRV